MGIDNNWCICVYGQSIVNADWDRLPKKRIAVNFAVDYVKDYTHFAAVDKVDVSKFIVVDDCRIVRIITSLALRMHGTEYYPGPNVDTIDYDEAIGTLDMAVMYAIINGAEKVILVGTDVYGSVVNGHSHRYKSDEDYSAWCKRVMDRCVQLCRDGGCEIEYI